MSSFYSSSAVSLPTWRLPVSAMLIICLPHSVVSIDEDHREFIRAVLNRALQATSLRYNKQKNRNRSRYDNRRRHYPSSAKRNYSTSYNSPRTQLRPHGHNRFDTAVMWQGAYPNIPPEYFPTPKALIPKGDDSETTTTTTTTPDPKNRNNKALLAIIVPLALLASLGPLMASQVLAPLAISGGLGGRRKRWLTSDDLEEQTETTEMKRRLHKLQAIRQYLTEAGHEREYRDDIMASYLECSGFMDNGNHCLERLTCEFADPNTEVTSVEREVMALIIFNIMNNEKIKYGVKVRMKRAALYGYRQRRNCDFFWCSKVDQPSSSQHDRDVMDT